MQGSCPSRWRALAFVAFVGVTAACGKSGERESPQAAQGFQRGQPGQQAYASQPVAQQGSLQPANPSATAAGPGRPAPAPGSQTAPGQVAPLGAILSDPNSLQNIIAGALAGGAASISGLAGGELGPIEQGIKMKAQQEAKGKKPSGDLMSARLGQDGHAQGALTLEPGHCYTLIGFGGFGVFQYQINLITAPPMPPQVLAQSAADHSDPTIGANEQCIKNPYPLPMQVKVDMHVVRGQGLVGVQAYRK